MLVQSERLMMTGELNSTLEGVLLTMTELLVISRMNQWAPKIATSLQKSRGNFRSCSLHGI
jgi:hypothetical protein